MTFKLREISQEEMPFLEFTTSHIAVSHLSRPSGESSKIVPVLSVNCGAACFLRQCQRLYFSRNRTFSSHSADRQRHPASDGLQGIRGSSSDGEVDDGLPSALGFAHGLVLH